MLQKLIICNSKEYFINVTDALDIVSLNYTVKKHHDELWHVLIHLNETVNVKPQFNKAELMAINYMADRFTEFVRCDNDNLYHCVEGKVNADELKKKLLEAIQ